MSVFDKVTKELSSGGHRMVIPSFQERIYIFKKDDIKLKLDESDSGIIIDLNPTGNNQFYKISGQFEAKSKRIQTRVGPRYQETLSINTSLISPELKYQLMILGNFRLCVITMKEESPVKMYGATIGLAVGSNDNYHYNIKFETIDGGKEPGLPKEIWIATADGSHSITATIAEIEKKMSL